METMNDTYVINIIGNPVKAEGTKNGTYAEGNILTINGDFPDALSRGKIAQRLQQTTCNNLLIHIVGDTRHSHIVAPIDDNLLETFLCTKKFDVVIIDNATCMGYDRIKTMNENTKMPYDSILKIAINIYKENKNFTPEELIYGGTPKMGENFKDPIIFERYKNYNNSLIKEESFFIDENGFSKTDPDNYMDESVYHSGEKINAEKHNKNVLAYYKKMVDPLKKQFDKFDKLKIDKSKYDEITEFTPEFILKDKIDDLTEEQKKIKRQMIDKFVKIGKNNICNKPQDNTEDVISLLELMAKEKQLSK